MKNIEHNKIIFNCAILVAAFSILFFLTSSKIVSAQSYSGSINPANLPSHPFIDGKNLSYYGMSAGSALQNGNAIPMNQINNVPAGQYINGSYSDKPIYYNSTNNANTVQLGYYQGNSYTGNSYTGNSYSGNSYSGNSYTSAVSYSGNSYSGNSYGGNSYGGNSYGGNSYGGSSQTASVASAFPKCEPYLKSYLGYGKNNNPDEVKKLQSFLNKYGGEKLVESGVFDLPTFDAVKRFQDKYAKDILEDSWGLSCNTGYVYITTLAKINDIVCNTNTNFSKIPLPEPRPVYYCDGHIDPVTNKPLPCTAVTPLVTPSLTSTSSVGAPSTGSLSITSTSSGQVTGSGNSTVSNQTASVGSMPISILGKAKNAWRKALGQ